MISAVTTGLIRTLPLLLLTGCVSTKTTEIDRSKHRSAVPPDTVIFYVTADKVPRPY